jgi:hypothetical protein
VGVGGRGGGAVGEKWSRWVRSARRPPGADGAEVLGSGVAVGREGDGRAAGGAGSGRQDRARLLETRSLPQDWSRPVGVGGAAGRAKPSGVTRPAVKSKGSLKLPS